MFTRKKVHIRCDRIILLPYGTNVIYENYEDYIWMLDLVKAMVRLGAGTRSRNDQRNEQRQP